MLCIKMIDNWFHQKLIIDTKKKKSWQPWGFAAGGQDAKDGNNAGMYSSCFKSWLPYLAFDRPRIKPLPRASSWSQFLEPGHFLGIPPHAPILWCPKPHYPIPYLAIDQAIYHVKIGGTLQKPPTVDLASSEPQLRLVKICYQCCVEFYAFKEPNILLILAIYSIVVVGYLDG